MKYKETIEIFEQIIELFNSSTEGLTTEEVYLRMQNLYTFKKTKRTLINFLKRLEAGEIDRISLTLTPRGRHVLKDMRAHNKEKIIKEEEKIQQKQQLMHDEKVYMRLAVESIKGMSNLSDTFHKSIEKRLRLHDLESAYFIESEKLEPINRDHCDFRELKNSIRNKYMVAFRYTGISRKEDYIVEPYKMIISNNLWYLYGKDTEEKEGNPYKTWRLKYIKNVESDMQSNHNIPNEEIEEVLSTIHSPYFVRGEEIDVRVKVDSSIIKEYDHYAHLPGYTGREEVLPDGSHIVHAKVSSLKELEKEIKMWLPHIEVLEPLDFQKKLLNELNSYLSYHKVAM